MAAVHPVTQLVAVGASAGGVEALSTLVATLPPAFPAPLVVAQHLDPRHPSHLQEILARRCPLPVRTVADHEPLQNGVVYVVPADRHIALDDHHLSVDQDGAGRPKPSIDLLFRSAAAVFGEGLIAVVLSGLGSDGAAGARTVKEAGGTVVIQNPRTAPYPAMPQALAPTTVDVVVDVDAMGPLLADLLTGAYTPAGPREDRQLRAFLAEVREHSGLDFSQYKEPTIQRRLQRRLLATGTHSLQEYRAYLERQPAEYDRLVNAFLIKVTEFFRDAALFAHLREVVVPALVTEGRARGQVLRLWSAGCATGEEAYSLALLVAEALGDELAAWTVRLFATDLDGEAVDFARRGVYPASALEGVPPELLARFFTVQDGTYTVTKALRSLLVFGDHDLGQRPPFPHIDLCLCRNVLIYFTPALQERALELFAFALREGGYLALGTAETTTPLPEYFAPLAPALRLYQRRGARLVLPQPPARGAHAPAPRPAGRASAAVEELARLRQETQRSQRAALASDHLLLHLPVGVAVVDRHYDLQHLNGLARALLGIPTAALGEDLMHLVRGLTPADLQALRGAIDAALGGEAGTLEAPSTAAVPGTPRVLRVVCTPYTAERAGAAPLGTAVPTPAPWALLVVSDVTAAVATQQEATRLETAVAELQAANQALRAANVELSSDNLLLRRATEEVELGNEEVQAAAEEVEALNEELQASNEELETLNEEQQASNEELETTNGELRARTQEAQALAALVERERQRLATILDSLGEAVVVRDHAGRQAFANAAFSALFGADAGFDAGFDAEDEEGQPLRPAQTLQERTRQGETVQLTFSRLSGGERRWYEATGRPLQHAEGGAALVEDGGGAQGAESVLVIRDITDRTLRHLQDSFLALASHEVRTPLTPLRGYIELAEQGLAAGQDPAQVQRYVTQARTQIERLGVLVQELLEVGRLSTGELRLHRVSLALGPLVAQAVEAARVVAPERVITLDAPAEPLVIRGDAGRLEQVVLHLLLNALRDAPAGPITVRLGQEAGQATLSVQDQGPGIPAEAQSHLFTRFYQVTRDGPGRPAQQGLGLGLYLAREIVSAHEGTIAVVSEPGRGATFTLRVPLAEGATADGAGAPQA